MSNPQLPERQQAFIESIMREDELGAVVRAGTYFEAYLRELVERNFVYPDAINWSGLSFQFRLQLAVALDEVPHDLIGALRTFATIRNAYAHRLDHKMSGDSLEQLVGTLTGKYREQFDGYAGLATGMDAQGQRLRSVLLVIEQNLAWATNSRTADVMVDVRKEVRKMKTLGIEKWLREQDD